MDELKKLCFECMGEKGEHHMCPHCGSAGAPKQSFPLLPLGSMVGGRYYIGKALKKNSEGVTYIAYDTKEYKACCIREFFPEALAVRDPDQVSIFPAPGSEMAFSECRDSFNELWKKLLRLKGLTSLISVSDVFTSGNTSYAVYAETSQKTLRDHLLSTPQGYLEWEQARIMFMPVLSTLGTLHTSGVIHKGISPESFIVMGDGKLKLSDFCIPQARLAYGELDTDLHDGYAPLEVYEDDGHVGTWTDIYSFSAVLYRTLIGTTPISAPVRAQNDQMMIPAVFAEKLPPYVINALINGMQIRAEDRTRNVEQLRSNLSASPRAVSASASIYKNEIGPFNLPGGDPRSAPGPVAPGAEQPVQPAAPRPRVPLDAHKLVDEIDETPVRNMRTYDTLSNQAQAALEEQKRKEKQRKRLRVLLVFIIIVLLVGVGLIVSSLWGSQPGTEEPTANTELQMMTVPNFVDSLFDSVSHDAYYSEFLHIIKVEENSPTVPAGKIMEQSIAVGTTVTKGTEILLTVSTGPKTFAVPDVTGRTYEEALAILAQQGLICQKASKYNDGTHTPETVAETFPLAGANIRQGDTIQVILWSDVLENDTDENKTDAQGNPVTEATREIPTDERGVPVIREADTPSTTNASEETP